MMTSSIINEDQPVTTTTTTSSSSSSSFSGGGGTGVPFQYSESKLEECLLRMKEEGGGTKTTTTTTLDDDDDVVPIDLDDWTRPTDACYDLYYNFLKHYHPDKADLWDKEEEQEEQEEAAKKKTMKSIVNHDGAHDEEVVDSNINDDNKSTSRSSSEEIVSRLFSSSFDRFCQTLRLVYDQNRLVADHQNVDHTLKLRLNQFADQPTPFGVGTQRTKQQQHWQLKVDEIWKRHESSSSSSSSSLDSNGNDGNEESFDDEHDQTRLRRRRRRRLQQRLDKTDEELVVESNDHGLDFATLLDSPEIFLRSNRRRGSSIITNEELGQHPHQPNQQWTTPDHMNESTETLSQPPSAQQQRRYLKVWKKPKEPKHPKAKAKAVAYSTYYATTTELSPVSTASMFTKVNLPSDGTDPPKMFACPKVPKTVHGIEVELYKGVPHSQSSNPVPHSQSSNEPQNTGLSSWSKYFFHGPTNTKSAPPTDSVVNKDTQDGDTTSGGNNNYDASDTQPYSFRKSLNWATTNNPDGVPLVHSVFDQGTCGSCWAFAATGSLEASAARNAAREYYVEGLIQLEKKGKVGTVSDTSDMSVGDVPDDTGDNDSINDLKMQTQIVEADTFAQTNLSIQELLDCDVAADQGCTGGNPLLAYFFIHRYGLVPWDEYPYAGSYNNNADTMSLTHRGAGDGVKDNAKVPPKVHKTAFTTNVTDIHMVGGTCQVDKISNPVATVQSWGLLHKDYEDLIELALLYVGPVAVGMNGADPAFVHYGSGIFYSPDCDQGANHALLIVGYDQVDVRGPDGGIETVRYWIARNSWGAGWGENGFVKIKRGPGGKHIPGVCGIARSPSVALGGQLRLDRFEPLFDNTKSSSSSSSSDGSTSFYPTKYHGTNSGYSDPNQMNTDHPFCDSVLPIGSKPYNGCIKISKIYDDHPGGFIGVLSVAFFLLAIVPLASGIMKRRRMEATTTNLTLDGSNGNGSAGHRQRRSGRTGNGVTTPVSETTHLLTLKDMYGSMRSKNGSTASNGTKPKGRCIIVKRPEQNPFGLCDNSSISDNNVTSGTGPLKE